MFKRGDVARDVRMEAAEGILAPRAHEQLAILILLLEDADPVVRTTANATLDHITPETLKGYLARADVPVDTREFFAARGVLPAEIPAGSADEPLIDMAPETHPEDEAAARDTDEVRASVLTQLQKMTFSQRLKAAMKGTREMRAILIRDPNKLIASSVLSSPKVNDAEVAGFARMANVGEDVLRIIGANRAWMKNYNVVLGLAKNPKTPLRMSLNLMPRLNDRDLQMLSTDRNVPETLRVSARKKLLTGGDRG
jgi:hypothetical protein